MIGFLLINKPQGVTSYDCVEQIKRILNQKIKIGHAGTLDPFASGLLIIAIGREATRELEHISTLDKGYVATGKLGELTDTLDETGTIIKTMDAAAITEEQIRAAINDLGTSYIQVPPIYSAVKYHGVPLHKLAREKRIPEKELQDIAIKKEKEVQLYTIELLTFSNPYFTIRAHVSHGTYIRSLVNDIANKAGNCATTTALERTRIGPFSMAAAGELSVFTTKQAIEKYLISVEKMKSYLARMPKAVKEKKPSKIKGTKK